MTLKTKIFTIRITGGEGESVLVAAEYGAATLQREIPKGQGISRVAGIFSEEGKLVDLEIITEPLP
jgi:hypothetical protein